MKSLFEDQKTTLRDFTERLEKIGINYMLTGSMAMINYAMMRLTADIDVVLDVYQKDADKNIKEFEADFYVPQNRVRDSIAKRFMFNLLHTKTLVKIDCVVRKDTEFQKNAFARREKVKFTEEFEVWIISREDLILSKLH